MNKTEGWNEFKVNHPNMMEETLGKEVSKVFNTIQKSGILGRFGVNSSAIGNFEALIKLFAEKAYNAGWVDRETQDLTTVTTSNKEEVESEK